MQSLAQQHFQQTKRLASKIEKDTLAKWFLEKGYYPEQYVLPPCFHVEKFGYRDKPYYPYTFETNKKRGKLVNLRNKGRAELVSVSFPKSQLTDRVFSVMEPRIYHDIVWYLIAEWELLVDSLFHEEIEIFAYSFPVPVTKRHAGLGRLRSGRMIYEFIEMAEKDLVADAFQYSYIVKTDIKNFYPSIYTHSLAWAIHGKQAARDDIQPLKLLGSKIDKLFQYANDARTNGLAIGPAVSDLAAELILADVDRQVSVELRKEKVKFLGVRFKDDYRILCHSKTDADKIIRTLRRKMREYNLSLSESKTSVVELPGGLFRPWIIEYQPFSLRGKDPISYKEFEVTLLKTLEIDKMYPNTGIINKFLSELISRDYKLKVRASSKQVLKMVSLLLLLKERRNKAFPQILALIELIIQDFVGYETLVDETFTGIMNIAKNDIDHLYENLWISYFLKTHSRKIPPLSACRDNPLFKSIQKNQQEMFTESMEEIILFGDVGGLLVKHVTVFPKE